MSLTTLHNRGVVYIEYYTLFNTTYDMDHQRTYYFGTATNIYIYSSFTYVSPPQTYHFLVNLHLSLHMALSPSTKRF